MATRQYSLFQRDGKRWVRVPGTAAYPKATAVRIFQDRLINSAFGPNPMSLRPVPEPAALVPASHRLCPSCENHHHNCEGGDCNCGCRIHQATKVAVLLLIGMLSVACGSNPIAPTAFAAAAPSALHTVVSCPDNERVGLGVDTHEGRVTLHITPVPGIGRYQVRIVGPATRSDVTSGSGMQDGNLLYGVSGLPAGNYTAYVSTLNDCDREGPSSSVEFSFAGDIVDEPTPAPTPSPEPGPTAHFYRTDDQEGLDTHLRRNHACDAWPAFGYYYETYAGLTNVCVSKMRIDLPRWTYLGELPYGG
jgi:hypothetical protein